MAPLGLFLKPMAPEEKSRIKKATPPLSLSAKAYKKSKLRKVFLKNKTPDSEEAESILKNKSKKFLVVGSARERLILNISLVAKNLKLKKQCLILVPEIFLAVEAQKRLEEEFPGEEIALFHGKIPKGQFYDQWRKIR